MKVFRNIDLKGVISKKKALKLLGVESQKNVKIKGFNIVIYLDDFYNVVIDYLISNELVGGTFQELK